MAVAVEREGIPILLHTHRANAIAAALIRAGKIPGLTGASIVRAEVPMGRSRFDFLLEKDGRPFYLEVKSCTLVGRRIAMFPDAVTARGKRHLEELAALGRRGTACGVLFLVHWPHACFFLPDYHTDLAFAQTFLEVKGAVSIMAVALIWRSDLSLSPEVREMAIPWDTIAREARDSGSYMILFHIPQDVTQSVGSLGEIHFPQGHYLYIGSAKRSLSKRIERHLTKATPLHWHIDYLKGHAERRLALPVRSSASLEHELAEAVGKIADGSIPSFGSSDCDCPGHLFHFADNPLQRQTFIDLLQYFRIDRLEERALPR
jgi:sugar fermentation stimulation protein A